MLLLLITVYKLATAIKGIVQNGGNNSRGDLAFSTRRNTTDSTLSESMRIDFSGNVGIGTSAPANLLQIQGDATFEQNAGGQFAIRGSTDSDNRFNFGFDTTNNYAWLQAITRGTAQRPIALNPSGGNVGIGTNSPGYALTVGSMSPTFGRVAQFNSSTTDSLIAFGTSGGTGENVAEIGADNADLGTCRLCPYQAKRCYKFNTIRK
jgi:hypothetical protein